MPLTISIDLDNISDALKTASREEKVSLVEIIEHDLLGEWDSYEESEEVKSRVNEALNAYNLGEVVQLRDIINDEL